MVARVPLRRGLHQPRPVRAAVGQVPPRRRAVPTAYMFNPRRGPPKALLLLRDWREGVMGGSHVRLVGPRSHCL